MSQAVTAVIPVWNRRDLLMRALSTMRAQTHPFAELLVIDNGSTDGSPEAAEEYGARVIRMGSNTGFSRAVNRGIEECRTPWVAIVNSDVELAPDWLETLLATAVPKRAWFATGKIFRAGSSTVLDGTYDAVCRGGCAWRVGHGRADGPEFNVSQPISLASGTAGLFRTELFRKIGPLDVRLESYLEDVDFGLRCATAGYGGWYAPEAEAWHHGSATLGRWHPEVIRRISRNQVLLVAKHYPKRLILRYGWPIVIAQALWGIVALRRGTGWAWLQGKIEGIRGARAYSGERRAGALEEILTSSECNIYRVQSKTGFDPYWRLYFLLTRSGAN